LTPSRQEVIQYAYSLDPFLVLFSFTIFQAVRSSNLAVPFSASASAFSLFASACNLRAFSPVQSEFSTAVLAASEFLARAMAAFFKPFRFSPAFVTCMVTLFYDILFNLLGNVIELRGCKKDGTHKANKDLAKWPNYGYIG
jgi:hypothetical protein